MPSRTHRSSRLSQAPQVPWKPTRAQLEAARNRGVPDLVAPGLRLLFVGINPGLYTAAIGHHFGRPGNRFWQALHAGGFTPRLVSPFEEHELLACGLGITNMVDRATARADELSDDELRAGARRLERLVRKFRPACIAPLGLTSYRIAFDEPRARLGLQPRRLAGAEIWLLPNPSGLNAHHQPADLARMFQSLRAHVGADTSRQVSS
jgi:TDG/mug DNA glycosylase family protein